MDTVADTKMRSESPSTPTEIAEDWDTVASDMSMSFVNVASATSVDQANAVGNVASTISTDHPNAAITLKSHVTPRNKVIGLDSKVTSSHACVTMKARDLPADDKQRAPVDIIVALDVSASMCGPKLELCKTTLNLLLRVLYPGDRFGLISYSDQAIIEIPAQKMTDANKTACAQKIKTLKTRGCTNISAAIGMAHQEMCTIESPNEIRSVFLLTDGLANDGIRDTSGLADLAKNCFSEDQITLHCFGYGSDHNSKLLEVMSSATLGGSYYFVDNDKNVGAAFGDALGGILSVVSQNVTVNVNVPDEAKAMGVEIVDVYHDQKIKRENGSYTIMVGDFYAEESRDVLFEIKLAKEGKGTKPIPHATVEVSFTDTLRKRSSKSDRMACLIARPSAVEVSETNQHVDAQLMRIRAANSIEQAHEMAMCANLSEARTTIKAAKDAIVGSEVYEDSLMLTQLAEDLDDLETAFESQCTFGRFGSHGSTNMNKMYKTQRCMDSKVRAKPNVFQNKYKACQQQTLLDESAKIEEYLRKQKNQKEAKTPPVEAQMHEQQTVKEETSNFYGKRVIIDETAADISQKQEELMVATATMFDLLRGSVSAPTTIGDGFKEELVEPGEQNYPSGP